MRERQIQLAKSILESHGYTVSKIDENALSSDMYPKSESFEDFIPQIKGDKKLAGRGYLSREDIKGFRSYIKSIGFKRSYSDAAGTDYKNSEGDTISIELQKGADKRVNPGDYNIYYKVGNRVSEGKSDNEWEYWEMPKDSKGPFEYPQYTKRYSDEIVGFIYPPYRSDNPRIESIDGYHAELFDDKRGDIIDSDDFGTMEDAKEYLDELSYRYI